MRGRKRSSSIASATWDSCSMFLLFKTFGTLDFVALFAKADPWPADAMGHLGTLTIAGLLLFTGACGKSAQLPLYVWLPDAMEGPTPVSALIHAATMVTAGVYVVARSHILFTHSETAMVVVAIVGCATAFFAATIGLVQTDIKKFLRTPLSVNWATCFSRAAWARFP